MPTIRNCSNTCHYAYVCTYLITKYQFLAYAWILNLLCESDTFNLMQQVTVIQLEIKTDTF